MSKDLTDEEYFECLKKISQKVREESVRINEEFSQIEHDDFDAGCRVARKQKKSTNTERYNISF